MILKQTVKWLQALLCNTFNSIQYCSFVHRQWSGYKHCYVTVIILFNIDHLYADSEVVTSIDI